MSYGQWNLFVVILFYESWIRNGICLTIACCRLLDQIVKNLGHLEDIYPVIKQLGGRHGTRGYDVPVKHMAVSLIRVFATKLQLLYFYFIIWSAIFPSSFNRKTVLVLDTREYTARNVKDTAKRYLVRGKGRAMDQINDFCCKQYGRRSKSIWW